MAPPEGPVRQHDPMEVALRQLGRRARTVQEVRTHLKGRGFEAEAVAEVLAKLSSLGYLDDRLFAARYAAWSAESRPMGRRRLGMELAHRGVSRETIDSVLDETYGPEQESEALQKALRKALRTIGGERRRVTAFLLRRGFRPAQVMAAIESCEELKESPWGSRDPGDLDT